MGIIPHKWSITCFKLLFWSSSGRRYI